MGKYSNPVATGVDFAGKRFRNEMSIPNVHDEDAALFSKIGQIAGDKPRGANALLAGFAKGAEYGSRTKSTAKKQEALSKYDRVMEYLQQMNHLAIERNNWYEKRDFARDKYLPQVMTYAQNVARYDPQTRQFALQGILDGYNEAIGENYKLKSIDGANPFIVTVGTSKGDQVIDMRNLFDGDQNAQARFNEVMPEYLLKKQQERQQQALENKYKEEALAIKRYQAGMPAKGEVAQQASEAHLDEEGNSYIPFKKLDKKAISKFQIDVTNQVKSIPINENALSTIQKMKDIFEEFPDIGSKFVNLLDDDDNENSLSNLIGRWALSKKEIAAMEKLKKASSDLNLSTILGITGAKATDLLKRAIKTAAPHGKLTKEGFDSIADDWEKKAKYNIELAEKGMQDLAKGRITVWKRPTNQSPSQDNTETEDDIDLSDLGGKPSNAGTF
jgi:hypothetical protein